MDQCRKKYGIKGCKNKGLGGARVSVRGTGEGEVDKLGFKVEALKEPLKNTLIVS